jgi:hypothetical protein
MLRVVMLTVVMLDVMVLFKTLQLVKPFKHFDECHYAEYHGAN